MLGVETDPSKQHNTRLVTRGVMVEAVQRKKGRPWRRDVNIPRSVLNAFDTLVKGGNKQRAAAAMVILHHVEKLLGQEEVGTRPADPGVRPHCCLQQVLLRVCLNRCCRFYQILISVCTSVASSYLCLSVKMVPSQDGLATSQSALGQNFKSLVQLVVRSLK